MQFKMNIKLSVTDTEVAEQENCLSIKHILNSTRQLEYLNRSKFSLETSPKYHNFQLKSTQFTDMQSLSMCSLPWKKESPQWSLICSFHATRKNFATLSHAFPKKFPPFSSVTTGEGIPSTSSRYLKSPDHINITTTLL